VVCAFESSAFDHLTASVFAEDAGIMAFVTVYFDDSGTHPESSIAVGAGFVSTVEQWREFNRNWEEAKKHDGFKVFHMADFASGHGEFANWDDTKKRRVLDCLCSIIRTRIKGGWNTAVTKKDYDQVIVEPFRQWAGRFHYTFCVRQCAGNIANWRQAQNPPASMRYVFDRTSRGKGEIMSVMDRAIKSSEFESKSTGIKPLSGYSFDNKAEILPLQAADIYAWTALQQMHKRLSGRRLSWLAELSFDLLSGWGLTHWGYFQEDNLRGWAEAEAKSLALHTALTSGI
jgi:hypothetical protein